jgi:hypothetical protein
MSINTNSAFLKEMGITEWTSRDAISGDTQANPSIEVVAGQPSPTVDAVSDVITVQKRASLGMWLFFGSQPQGDAAILFQNVIRVLGLAPQEWTWRSPTEIFNPATLPQDGTPIVALAFGGAAAQKLSGERDALPELRETVLAMNADGAEDLPLIATFELNQLIARPKDKALLWQDLLLAKSVLQNS